MSLKMNLKNNVLKGKVHYLTSDYKTRNENRSTHNGMDFVGENGIDDIIAYASGVVKYIKYDSKSGHWIGIKTNDYEHRYFHLDGNKIYVRIGDYVNKGDVIACMGKSGNATNYCLHFAIYQNAYVDPLPYLMGEKGELITNYDYEDFINDLRKVFNLSESSSISDILSHTITLSTSTNKKHPAVKVLQKYLQSLGYNLGIYGIDGTFGPAMKSIIKDYQKNIANLKENNVDGILTAKMHTWKSLLKVN